MKALLVFIFVLCTFMVSAQQERERPKVNSSTSRTINLDSIKKTPKSPDDLKRDAMEVPLNFVYKGKKYQGYQSNSGKTFIIVQSPTSKNWYRKYINFQY